MERYGISILKEEDYEEYNHFVSDKNNKEILYEHSLEVKDLVSRHFSFKPVYLVAKEENKIVGALPLFEAKSFIEGKRLVSIPFFPFGGVIGKDIQCKKELLKKAREMAETVRFLEIRQRNELEPELTENFVQQSPITDFLLYFGKTEEETFISLDKRVRYDIKKAQRNNLKVQLGKEKKLLDDFYEIYLNTKKKRGVPAWPYDLFKDALETCNCLIGVTYLENKPIASAFFFLHKAEIEYGFAGADYKYAFLCPYYVLLWETIRYGIRNNYQVLDFGGTTKEMSEGTLYAFKERWCKKKKEISYYFYAGDKKKIPTLKRSFKAYKLYGKIWSLLPRIVIKKISPFVIRQFV